MSSSFFKDLFYDAPLAPSELLIEVSRTPLLSTANSLSGLILATLLASSVGGEAPHDAVALFDRAMAAAEVNLRAGHPEVAEMKYREAMMEGHFVRNNLDNVLQRERNIGVCCFGTTESPCKGAE